MPPSFVIGNSPQLDRLSADDRAALDRLPFVLTCNAFPQFWRMVGFRPTVWVCGDTYDDACCDFLTEQLNFIRRDAELRERLQTLFLCAESPRAAEIIQLATDLPITPYRRGGWADRGQQLAGSFSEPIYHYGSTLTDVVNLALLLNPGGEVRLCGCQYGDQFGHFYHADGGSNEKSIFSLVVSRMWEGFHDIHRAGVNLVDCNFEHGANLPGQPTLPRKSLLNGLS